jgi:hypothetical protein
MSARGVAAVRRRKARELAELRRRRRSYAAQKRAEQRRAEREDERRYRSDVRAGAGPARAEPDRKMAADETARIERQVRSLVERGLDALADGRWHDAGGYFIDGAAVLDAQAGTIVSRDGYELIPAEDADALAEVISVGIDERGQARAVVHR